MSVYCVKVDIFFYESSENLLLGQPHIGGKRDLFLIG